MGLAQIGTVGLDSPIEGIVARPIALAAFTHHQHLCILGTHQKDVLYML